MSHRKITGYSTDELASDPFQLSTALSPPREHRSDGNYGTLLIPEVMVLDVPRWA